MQKAYGRINWENYPSEETPINESNLNRMDFAINEIDDRVINLDSQKASVTVVDNLIAGIAVDDETGVITITKQNGAQVTIQTTLGKLAINFGYDYESQDLLLYLNDGTVARVSLSSLIQNNEFKNTTTINLSVSPLGIVTASVVSHSIGEEQLRTDYLAEIQISEAHADQYQQDAQNFSFDSEAWAKGTRAASPVTEGQNGFQDNSKYYKGRSEAWATGQIEGITVPPSDVTYENNSKYYVGRSEAWAVGQIQGDPVLPGDPAYENNSKYYSDLSASIRDATEQIRSQAADLLQSVTNRLTGLHIMINYSDGRLYYDINSGIRLVIDPTSGNLLYEVVV